MIERTQDYRRVKTLTLANPMGEDEPFNVVPSSDYFYLMETDGNRDIGVWCFEPEPHNDKFSMHSCMSADCRGKRAVESGLRAIGWMYENTPADVILAPVPGHLRHAQLIPRTAGLMFEGETDYGYKVYKCDRDLFAHIKRD